VGNARSAIVDPLAERLSDCPVQAPDFVEAQTVRGAKRADSRSKERLISVNVTDAGDQLLVEQSGLYRSRPLCQALKQHFSREGSGERLGTDLRV
jgi:hypothetical protein